MTKTINKKVIWSNFDTDPDGDTWREYNEELEEEYGEMSEDEKYQAIYDDLNEYLEDERSNLDIQLDDEIVVIGAIGRWNCTARGYKIIKSGNISDCLYDECDFAEWYVDRYNLCFSGAHHDGKNSYIYRTWRDGLSDAQKDNFLDKIYQGKATSKDITRYTKSLKLFIDRVYGW